MPTTSVRSDPEQRTVTLEAVFPVPVERLWGAFTDPRQLDRFWGPPGFPATFTSFDLRPGGRAHYRMTSAEGERFTSVWLVHEVEEPHRIAFADLFATEDGEVDGTMPESGTELSFRTTDAGSALRLVTTFPTSEDLEAMLDMGILEGYRQAFGQLDGVLDDPGGREVPGDPV